MNVLTFINMWINSSGYICIYTETDYLIATQVMWESWNQFHSQVTPHLTFNASAQDWFMFLPKEVQKAKVLHFGLTSDKGLILFTNLKKNIK